MKKYEIFLGAIRLPLDFLIIFGTFFLARKIRLGDNFFIRPGVDISVEILSYFALFGAILFVLIFSIHGLYSIKRNSLKLGEFSKIILYSFYWFIFFSFFVYASKGLLYETEIPRLISGFTFVIGTFFVIIERIILGKLQYFFVKKGILTGRKILLINNKKYEEIEGIIKNIELEKIYQIIGYSNTKQVKSLKELAYLGGLEEISKKIENREIDEVLYIDSNFSKEELYNLWELTRIFGVTYNYVTNSFEIEKTNTSLSFIGSLPVVEIKNTSLNSWMKIFKRIFDFVVGIFGVIILSPVFIIVAILIKIEDPAGPVIYKNKRIGQDSKFFNLYKFRYMKWEFCTKEAYSDINDDKAMEYEKELIQKSSTRNGPLYKIKDDPRKTKVGAFIEKYSIDELPQFFNLIIGNMSLVGPRPHQEREVEKYSIAQKRLLTIKPGITGMAQVNGREENTFEREAELDIFYIENWSVALDFKIILKTFYVVIYRIFNKKT